MYALGVDLGTTFTAAAVWRDGRAEISPLGMRTAAIPSVVLARPDGSFLVGEAAARRAAVEPDRVAREFKRRLGDSTPLLLGGSPYSAEALTARLLSSVVAAVADREGGAPSSVCICHPANWGPFKTDLLRQAIRLADLGMPVVLTTEPEAAAFSYARQERLTPGDTVAVYDLGGGTFDAAVLRRTARGFEIVGQPEGIERLGGIDIDAAVFNHVVRSVGAAFADLDEDDPVAVSAVARLREECTAAKEALSSDTDVEIPVLLPALQTEVRLTRAELEEMIRPSLYDSIESLKRAVRSAGAEPADLSAVLLVGGSSRMPLVSQMVGSELGRPVAVDAHPKHAIALGAAWRASGAPLPADTEPAPATVVVATMPRPEPGPEPGPVVPSRQVGQQSVQPPVPLPAPSQAAPSQAAPPQPPARQQLPARQQPAAQQQSAPPQDFRRSAAPQPPRRPVPGADGYQVLRPAQPGSPPAGYPSPGYPAPPTGSSRPSAGPVPPSGPLPFDPTPQSFADPGQQQPARFAPAPRAGRRPVVVGGLAGLGALLVVLSVFTAFKARDTFGMTSGGSSPSGTPTAAAPGAPGPSTGSGQADVAPTGTTSQGTAAGTGTLLVVVQVSGRGTVRSSDGQVDCPGSCRVSVPATSQLTLTAYGDGFVGWSQCPQRDGRTCTVGGRSGQVDPIARFSTGATSAPPPVSTTSPPSTTTAPPSSTSSSPPPSKSSSPPTTTSAAPSTTASPSKSSAPPSSSKAAAPVGGTGG